MLEKTVKRDKNYELNREENVSFFIVPPEIDTHFQLYGKYMWEVSYHERCPICERRMDEFGFCACNGCAE